MNAGEERTNGWHN